MLVKFTVSNYLSFKDKTGIDLTATSLTEYRTTNIFESSFNEMNLLRSLIIYGANSSGKSNLFKALSFLKRFILNSSKDSIAGEEIPVERFKLSTETENKPSHFEIEFITSNIKYRYSFEVDTEKVYTEYLYYAKKTKEYLLFKREGQEIIFGKKFDISNEKLKDITRENALFLSVCSQFNDSLANSIIDTIRNIHFVSAFDEIGSVNYKAKMYNDKSFHAKVNTLLSSADLGFSEIVFEKVSTLDFFNRIPGSKDLQELQKIFIKDKSENFIVRTRHLIYDKSKNPVGEEYFDLLQEESLGTRKIFALAGPIIDTLDNGGVLVIDEFDSRLHPGLCKAIIKLFNCSEKNPNNAQLIVVSHNSNFINSTNQLFRRDQIIIAGKDILGITRTESLFQKKIRKDASFEKDYLSGKYDEKVINLEIDSQLSFDLEN